MSECSVSSGLGDDEIVSSSSETMTNPAMTAPIITALLMQVKCHGIWRDAGGLRQPVKEL